MHPIASRHSVAQGETPVKTLAIGAAIGLLMVLYVYEPDVDDAPLWLHIVGWYLGVAIWVSLTMPMRVGRTRESMKDVGPMTKVLGGLAWPVLLGVWVAARFL
jgi:hypothetical protein